MLSAGPKSIARTMDAANCAAVLLSVPIMQLPLPRLYSATGRARRRKWRYIKYTPLPLPLTILKDHKQLPNAAADCPVSLQ